LANILHVLPPITFLVLAGLGTSLDPGIVFEPPLLLPLLNTVLLSVVPFAIAFLAARAYAAQGSRAFLWLGCGMVAFGLGSLLSGWGIERFGQNYVVTLHNVGSLFGGPLHLVSAGLLARGIPSARGLSRRRAGIASGCAYGIVAALLLLVSRLTIAGALPVFFVQGTGPSFIRQVSLIFAAASYILSAMLLVVLYAQTGMAFLRLYANALFLMAIGLASFLLTKNVGGLLAWIGRASQYAGGAYFIAALVAASRDARMRGASLPASLNELFRLSLEREVGVRTRELVDLNQRLQVEIAQRQRTEEQLRFSREELKSIYHHSPIMMCTLDRDRHVLYANQAFTDFTGVPEEELRLGRACGVFGCINALDDERGCGFGPRCEACRIRLAIEDTLATGAAHQNVEYAATLEHAGSRREVALLGSTVLIPGPHQPHLLLTFLDVTDRRRVAERLRRSEEEYRMLIDTTIEGFSIVQDGRIMFANRALAEICGYPVPELLRLSAEQVAAIVHPDDRARVLGNMARRLAGEEAPAAQSIRFLYRDGSERWVETHSVPIEYEGRTAIQVGCRDITVQRAAEDDLRVTHQKMRNLATHLLHAREEERKTVAQEIHDELGQVLTALKMDLRWLEKRLDHSKAHLLVKMRGMIGLTDQTIQKVQRISSELRPRMLDDLGLAAAIEWLGGDFSRHTGIKCKTVVQVTESRIGGNSATAIYRVVQEALTNISRHANASRVSLLLSEADEHLEVLVKDDGIGISETQATDTRSFGLLGIRERVRGLGGEVSIRGETGKGTTVAVSIPYPGGGNLA
jgi:PAS domain S-box-containing protein